MFKTENEGSSGRVTMKSSAEVKEVLVRRSFWGREDVFAKRLEIRKTGKRHCHPIGFRNGGTGREKPRKFGVV